MENQGIEIVPAESLKSMIQAEQESSMDIARRYPRQITQIKSKVRAYATCDKETASSCFYSKPVDDKGSVVEGPSIRLAEIIAATYGNIKFGSRVVGIEQRFVTVQGVAVDLENNISYSTEIKRSIWGKKGRYGQNMIETTIKAAGAIAVRDAIYKVVPMGIFSQELELIKQVAAGTRKSDGSKAEPKELAERAKKAVKYFVQRGVPEKRILIRLNVENIEDIAEPHLIMLTGFRNAIKDEEITIDEAFPLTNNEEHKQKGKTAQDNLKGKIGKMNGDQKKESDLTANIDAEVKSLNVLGITTDQICSYFELDNVHSMDESQLSKLAELHDAISEQRVEARKVFPPAQK